MTDEELLEQMIEALAMVDTLMGIIRAEAAANGTDPMMIRGMGGELAMIPLVAAKAQLLPGIAQLKAKVHSRNFWRNLGKDPSDG